MKNVFLPLALLVLVLCAPCAAQTSPAAPLTAVAAPPSPASVAAFLATLSGGAGPLPVAPSFLTTTCHSNDECPEGLICCYPCGIDGCDNICMEPWGKTGECPPFA